jgi:ClpP class serine protease
MMSDEDLIAIADGRVLTAEQALQLHAVDSVGYLDDAIDEAICLAGLKQADVVLYRARPHYNANIYASAKAQSDPVEGAIQLLLHRADPRFLYLWSPGL